MSPESHNSDPNPPLDNSPQHEKDEEETSGVPLRGLAMVLITVAVLLGAWSVWALTNRSGDEENTNDAAATSNAPQNPSSSPAASTSAEQPATSSTNAGSAGSTTPGATSETSAPAAGGSPVSTVYVLNNSTVAGLSARVGQQLKGDYPDVETGNLPDARIQQNTVFYPAGNPQAEQEAKQLASRVGGIAAPRSDVLPRTTEGPNNLVLVLVQDTAVKSRAQ